MVIANMKRCAERAISKKGESKTFDADCPRMQLMNYLKCQSSYSFNPVRKLVN